MTETKAYFPRELYVEKLTSKCLKRFVGVVSQEGLTIFVLLTRPNQLGLVCSSEGHRELTLETLTLPNQVTVHDDMLISTGRSFSDRQAPRNINSLRPYSELEV